MKKGEDKEIVRLHKEGKSFRQIGLLLGISHVAVRKRYLKALKGTSNAIQSPKSSLANHISSTTNDLGFPSNSEGSGNLRKPKVLTKVNVALVNKSSLPKDIRQHDDRRSGNPENEAADVVKDNLTKPYIQGTVTAVNYLRKIGTNEVFAFSEHLVKRGDMVPYTGPVPVSKDFEIPEIERYFMKVMQDSKEKSTLSAEGLKEFEKIHEVNPVNFRKLKTEELSNVDIKMNINPSEMIINDSPEKFVNYRKLQVQSLQETASTLCHRDGVNLRKLDVKNDNVNLQKPSKSSEEIIIELRKQGKPLSFIGKSLGISKTAVHKRLKRISMKRSDSLTSEKVGKSR
ncbi:MAG: hypothetical protein IBX72_06960 [Nitrospirae bacterium]|nr:hypothetical protein [Nitrospirota bacterium]